MEKAITKEKRIGTSLQTETQDLTKYSSAIKPLITTSLKVHPACLEFAPSNISHSYPESVRNQEHEYFVVGTYQLAEELDEKDGEGKNSNSDSDDKHQERIGGLSLFRLSHNGAELYHIQDIFHPYGIYDLKFLPHHPILAASTTTGRIAIFKLGLSSPSSPATSHSPLELTELSTHLIFPSSEPIITSISWFPLFNAQDTTRILALTVEDGGLYLIRFNSSFTTFEILNNGQPIHEHVYKTPFFENKERVWCCAFSSPGLDSNSITMFSGGDDNYFRSSTLKFPAGISKLGDCKSEGKLLSQDEDDDEDIQRVQQIFQAGVTSILSLPLPLPLPLPILTSSDTSSHNSNTLIKTQTLLIGSYDNNIYLVQLSPSESPSQYTALLNLDLGGGVYRLKLISSSSTSPSPSSSTTHNPASHPTTFKILACCMHAGTKILSVERTQNGIWKMDVLAEVNDNESMCYAADIQKLPISAGDSADGMNGSEKEEGKAEEEGERICVSSSWADSKLSIWKYTPEKI